MDLKEYDTKRKSIKKILKELESIAHTIDSNSLANKLAKEIKQLDSEKFELVVVGEFSRGKSTFINALLGKSILPSSVRPTTALISKITYGTKPECIIHYKDGGKSIVSVEEFKKIKAAKEKDKANKANYEEYLTRSKHPEKIDYAEVKYPLSICKDNVEVVDTPGTNDLNAGRVEITYRYLNCADAVIMMLAADQPITASEEEFLRTRILGNQINDIFFVVNHKDDLCGGQEEENVIDYISEQLKNIIKHSTKRIYLVSSLQALLFRRGENGEELKPQQIQYLPDSFEDTGFVDLERSLGKFLSKEKGNAKLEKYKRHAANSIEILSKDISNQMEIAQHTPDEIRNKIKRMKPHFSRAEEHANYTMRVLERNLKHRSFEIENICQSSGRDIRSSINNAIDNYTGELKKEALSNRVNKATTPGKIKLIEKIKKVQEDIFLEENKKATNELIKIWNDIDLNYQNTFSLSNYGNKNDLKVKIPDITVLNDDNPKASDILFGAGLATLFAGPIGGLAVGAFAYLRGWFSSDNQIEKEKSRKEKIKRDIFKNFDVEFDKLTKNIIQSYQKSVDEFCSNIEQNIRGRLYDMNQQLERLLQEKESQEYTVENKVEELQSLKDKLKKINELLEK